MPKGVIIDEPLQAYFRMNSVNGGQFEHTLIIVDDDAQCDISSDVLLQNLIHPLYMLEQ